MLQHLHIKNIALIDELSIDFSGGLNVLTGETGAGKSIIVDSVNLVLGERADRELIKTGCESAAVEAVFDISHIAFMPVLAEYGFDGDDTLIFSRELSVSGKNICRVNGRLTTLSVLKELSDRLVDLHGQHEHQSLLDEKKHLDFLDKYAGDALSALKEETALKYDAYRDVQKRLRGMAGAEGERDRKLDILKFQIDEIKRARIAEAEEVELNAERSRLLNSEKITTALNMGYDTLYSGDMAAEPLLGRLKHVISEMDGIKALDDRYGKALEKLNDIYYSLEEAAFEFRELKDEAYFDPQRLEEIENRLQTLHTLKRKYGGSIEAVLDFLSKAESEYNDLLDSEHLIAKLNEDLKHAEEELAEVSRRLSKKRGEFARAFEQDVLRQLNDLGMKNSRFEVRFLTEGSAYSRNGIDNVEFYISTNPGEPVKPLKKVVSGGEVSRIMLALKNISAGLDDIQCMIFDEIDTGISGQMAHVVGEKMMRIAKARQVICVTHLPQIAAFADRHFLITKQSTKESTSTEVMVLDAEKRVREIARLAGGSESQAAFAHAGELLARAEKIKKTF